MGNQTRKAPPAPTLRKVARIWSVVIFVITALIFIGEASFPLTEGDYPPIENLMPFLMFFSVVSLGLAWRRELLGGVLNIVFFIVNFILYWIIRGRPFPFGALAILSLTIVPGVLFVISGELTRRTVVREEIETRS